jgi:hypothetical protein
MLRPTGSSAVAVGAKVTVDGVMAAIPGGEVDSAIVTVPAGMYRIARLAVAERAPDFSETKIRPSDRSVDVSVIAAR